MHNVERPGGDGVEDSHDLRFEVCVVAAKVDEQNQINSIFKQYFGEPKGFHNGLLYSVRLNGAKRSEEEKRVFLTTCGASGNMQAGIVVSEMIYRYHPSLILFVGTAGSMNHSDLKLGDVVIPTRVAGRLYERIVEEGEEQYNSFMRSGKKPELFHERSIVLTKADTIGLDPASLALIGALDLNILRQKVMEPFEGASIDSIPRPNMSDPGFQERTEGSPIHMPKIHVDFDVFTCDWLINSSAYRDFVKGEIHTRAVAVDMESLGYIHALSRATSRNSFVAPRSLIVRGISDYAGRRSDTKKDPRWGKIANRNAALVAAEIARLALTWVKSRETSGHKQFN